MQKQEIEAELYKEQFITHLKKVLMPGKKKKADIAAFVRQKETEEKINMTKMGDSIQAQLKKTIHGEEKSQQMA